MKLKAIKENITLDNVKKSNYWDLIGIIIWNHYSEEKYQDESMITIYEDWYGNSTDEVGGGSYSQKWDDPSYTEEGYIRTLDSIKIQLSREDYTAWIYISTDGRVRCLGSYTDKERRSSPYFSGIANNMEICNWLLENNLIEVVK